jgi:uncharacterized membrane protein YdbT with pleckstrin-like domain
MSILRVNSSQLGNVPFFVLIVGLLGVPVGLMIVNGASASPIAATGCLLLIAALKFIHTMSLRYRVNAKSLEAEAGIFSRRLNSVEFSHVTDVRLSQGLMDRVWGVGTIELYTADMREPVLRLHSIDEAHATYGGLKDLIQTQKGR